MKSIIQVTKIHILTLMITYLLSQVMYFVFFKVDISSYEIVSKKSIIYIWCGHFQPVLQAMSQGLELC